MLATDDEIRAIESHALRNLPEAERLELVEHAVERNRQAREKTMPRDGCANRTSFRNGNLGRPPMPAPTNAAELLTACVAEACRLCGCEVGEIMHFENSRARMWVVVALAYVPATGVKHARNGRIGLRLANRMTGYYDDNGGQTWVEKSLAMKWPVLAMQAREFGAGLRATWEVGA